jgi:hypothetical protein
MFKNKQRLIIGFIFSTVLFLNSGGAIIFAQSSSNNYKIEEYYFGTGGEVESSSPNYKARQSTGSLGVGNTSSDNFDANTGFNTPSEPFLEMAVMDTSVNFGELDFGSTSYGSAQAGPCNCSFYVKTYLSGEYIVVTASPPPTSEGGEVLNAKSVAGAPSSNDSVEEFGMNLVANTVPALLGDNSVNQPDDTFADGEAASGYNQPNNFKYGVGDIIARSQATPGNPAVGLTEYTISYIAKPGINTPAGFYQMNHELIVIATF